MKHWGRGRNRGVVIAAAALLWTTQAQAQGPDKNWMNSAVGSRAYASNDLSDRELIKEWEANPEKGFATLSPSNVIPMKAAIIRYTAIVAKGGWRTLPDMKLQPGATHAAVAIMRERLTMSGELKDGGSSENFDYSVEKAVRRYQAANGLAPTGIADKITIAAMNVLGRGAAQAAQDQF